ncbi:MAG: hypothetical protein LM587_01725 [Candidatus Aenigmarchaeota archaeon]|nr:hypothetical protein [Candidatus Aenigmarchaeota archaeon]
MSRKLIILFTFLLVVGASLAQPQILERSCEGDYVAAKVNDSGSIGYRILEYCHYGCKYGICLSKREIPIIEVKESYSVTPCQDNLIFISIKNVGTKGEINLSIDGEVASWIKLPRKISLESNQSRVIALVVSVPCNASGIYPFTLIGSGALTFYAPSILKVTTTSPLPITTTINFSNLKFVFPVVTVLLALLAYKHWIKKPVGEEKVEM